MRRLLTLLLVPAAALASLNVDFSRYKTGAGATPIRVAQRGADIVVEWTDESSRPWHAVFALDPDAALIREIAQGDLTVLRDARPLYSVTTGKRRGGWDAFFDNPGKHPEEVRSAAGSFRLTGARVRTLGNRVELRFDGLELGIFSGGLAYTFFPGSRLVKQEAVVRTAEPDVAYFYDAAIRAPAAQAQLAWYDTSGSLKTAAAGDSAQPLPPVRYRTVSASWNGGSLAVFPAPHQYFMPRDYTTNLGHLSRRATAGFVELGIKQYPDDGTRYYPWMNAPPGTPQRLALFLLLGSNAKPGEILNEALRYTNFDRFPALPGHKTLATHWHFGYTVQAMKEGFDKVPSFKPVLKRMGVNIAMIMDFHGDGHPNDVGDVRLEELDAFFRACRAQSDGDFLLLPAEEANVHLGGHWALFFPRPVYWYHLRPEGRSFLTTDPKRGKIYATGNAAEVLDLVRREQGLMWQTHPRTKGSTGFPDTIRRTEYFLDPRWLGAGWKQMPSDLSLRFLGERSLRLLDDMNNWGLPKKLLAEVDVFKIDDTHELYGHMNVNYLRLPSLPSFDNYSSVTAAIEKGDYFAATGEVLIPQHSIDRQADSSTRVRVRLRWTFPLHHAEVAWGDGSETKRHVIPLEDTAAFGERDFEWKVPAGDWKWMRLAVWDIAANGAFVNPVQRRQLIAERTPPEPGGAAGAGGLKMGGSSQRPATRIQPCGPAWPGGDAPDRGQPPGTKTGSWTAFHRRSESSAGFRWPSGCRGIGCPGSLAPGWPPPAFPGPAD